MKTVYYDCVRQKPSDSVRCYDKLQKHLRADLNDLAMLAQRRKATATIK